MSLAMQTRLNPSQHGLAGHRWQDHMYPCGATNTRTRRKRILHCQDGNGVCRNITSDLSCLYELDRLLGFGACLLGAAACFLVAFISLPLLAIRPSKFALAFRCIIFSLFFGNLITEFERSLGSLLVMFG